MTCGTITTASFTYSFGWARFMGTGFFGMDKSDER